MTEAAIIFHMHREMEINSLQREKHETGSTSLLWCYSQLLHGGFNNTNVLRYISGDRNPKSVSLGLNLGVGWAIPRALWGERILCFFSFEMCIPWPVAPSYIFKASSTATSNLCFYDHITSFVWSHIMTLVMTVSIHLCNSRSSPYLKIFNLNPSCRIPLPYKFYMLLRFTGSVISSGYLSGPSFSLL